jgi:sec-independent protein translocase protein TatA
MLSTIPLFVMPGGLEIAVILLVVVLLFGANKLPELAHAAGQSMSEFHKGREAVERELFDIRTPTKSDNKSVADAETVDLSPTYFYANPILILAEDA